MRIYLSLLVAFLALTNAALGGVGDVGVSDGYNLQPSSSYMAGAAQQGGLTSQTPGLQPQDNLFGSTGYPVQQDGSLQPSGFQQPLSGSIPDQYAQTTQPGVPEEASLPFNQGGSVSGQNYQSPQIDYLPASANQQSSGYMQPNPVNQIAGLASAAPQLSGPYQEHFSPEDLRLSQPQAEVFKPQGSLNFATANPPTDMLTDGASAPDAVSATAPGYAQSGSWYYPKSMRSENKFYVQTSSGFRSVAGCSYGGYVPLWANIASSDNFYVYEWYPGQTSPYVRWWGWTWPGWKKGWFSGDVPGWHILCFHCRDWSNYVYIYVWPGAGTAVSGNGPMTQPAAQSSFSLPSGAPTPPDLNAENPMLPDYRMISQEQSGNPGQIGFNPGQGGYNLGPVEYNPGQGGYGSQGGYASQTFKTVFPKPTAYRCNEYYVQGAQGRLNTVGSVKCGEWLPLWSMVGKPGCYWSFEWTQGCTSSGSFCYPEVKNFGYKGTGWCSTWFRGNKPGWHILSYFSNDWSNYVYVYVWSPN